MKINKTNLTKLLIKIQDNDGIQLACNAIATKAVKDFGLEKIHCKLTGTPKSSYNRVITQEHIKSRENVRAIYIGPTSTSLNYGMTGDAEETYGDQPTIWFSPDGYDTAILVGKNDLYFPEL